MAKSRPTINGVNEKVFSAEACAVSFILTVVGFMLLLDVLWLLLTQFQAHARKSGTPVAINAPA